MGTESWAVNERRIDYRVLANTGHYVDPKELPNRYRWSLSNLRERLGDFDVVEVADNSKDTVDRIPDPVLQFVAERGVIETRLPPGEMGGWCAELLRQRKSTAGGPSTGRKGVPRSGSAARAVRTPSCCHARTLP